MIFKSCTFYACVFLSTWTTVLVVDGDTEGRDHVGGEMNSGFVYLQAYRSAFAAKRKEEVQTAEKILALDNYARQYQMIEILMDTIVPAINKTWTLAKEVQYIAGDSPFPDDQEFQEALGAAFEGIPFFGDVLLRLPDITKKVYRHHQKEWGPIVRWGLELCRNSSAIFNGHHAKQLDLIAQEMGFAPRDPNYMNPFSQSQQKKPPPDKRPSKNKPTKKGPRLRTTKRTEL